MNAVNCGLTDGAYTRTHTFDKTPVFNFTFYFAEFSSVSFGFLTSKSIKIGARDKFIYVFIQCKLLHCFGVNSNILIDYKIIISSGKGS